MEETETPEATPDETPKTEEEASSEEDASTVKAVVKSRSMIETADMIATRMEKAAAKMDRANAKYEAIIAEEALTGRARAGFNPADVEQTPQQFADSVMKGELSAKQIFK